MKKFLCTVIALSFFLLSACGEEVIKPNESGVDTSVENSDQSETTSTEVTESTSDGEYSFESSEQPFSEESSDEDVVYSGDYGYTLVNTVAMICAYKGKDTEITLPSELDGYTVTAVTDDAVSGKTSIKRITLSDTVVNVGEGAFVGCSSLEYVFIGSSVAVLHSGAFDGCKALKEIEVSSANKSFSSVDGVLYNGDKTVLLRCPEAVEKEELKLPATVGAVEAGAFSFCKGVKKVELPDGCALGERAFYYCMDLEDITFGEGLEDIPEKCFFGCVMLKEIAVPEGVKSIGNYAFFGCISVKKATLPASVESIGDNVFKNCSALKTIETAGEYCKNWYNETGKDYINS